MTMENIFQFMLSEEGEPALFIYARESQPNEPLLHLMPKEHKANLYRNGQDIITLNLDDAKIIENLKNKQKLLVCEVLPAENANEVEIIKTYLVDITI
jgi:hypothetical protein